MIFQQYDEEDEDIPHEEVKLVDDDDQEAEDDESTTTTTTTTTTRRSVFNFPTRNRNMIPSRRPIQVNLLSAEDLSSYFVIV